MNCTRCNGETVVMYEPRTSAPMASPREMLVNCGHCGGTGREPCENCDNDATVEIGDMRLCDDCAEDVTDTCSLCDRPIEPAFGADLCDYCAGVAKAHGRLEQARIDEERAR